MSKVVCLCLRNSELTPRFEKCIALLNRRLSPDNINPHPPRITSHDGVHIAVINPMKSVSAKRAAVCVGNMIAQPDDWSIPKGTVPDGSYALFRADRSSVELLTDAVASQTIWYAKTQNIFVASTSQRAIVFLLEDFQPNANAFSWILSSGALGPGNSWDSRIRPLGPDASLLLDIPSWKVAIKQRSIAFAPVEARHEEHRSHLKHAIRDVFENLALDYSQWDLALSGGFDSRAILLMLKDREKIRCITWGLKSSLSDKRNDAYLARTLAQRLKVKHKYYETDATTEPVERVFHRYLVAGEGRVEHISGYMDGFKLWKQLFEEKRGIIRGAECFGWSSVDTPFETRDSVGIRLLSDYSNLRSSGLDVTQQVVPEYLQRKKGESLATWRDRLCQQYEIPVIHSALNDLKCSYVEVLNPLISRRIVEQVRLLPDSLRTGKRLFKEIVRDLGPNMAFAKRSAIDRPENILRSKHAVELIRDTLNSSCARGIMGSKLTRFILGHMEVSEGSPKVIPRRKHVELPIRKFIPATIRRIIKRVKSQKCSVDFNVLAFRAYIICEMCQMLRDDAQVLKSERLG